MDTLAATGGLPVRAGGAAVAVVAAGAGLVPLSGCITLGGVMMQGSAEGFSPVAGAGIWNVASGAGRALPGGTCKGGRGDAMSR